MLNEATAKYLAQFNPEDLVVSWEYSLNSDLLLQPYDKKNRKTLIGKIWLETPDGRVLVGKTNPTFASVAEAQEYLDNVILALKRIFELRLEISAKENELKTIKNVYSREEL